MTKSTTAVFCPNRRTVLAGLGASLSFAATLRSTSALAQATTLTWWDHFQPLAPLLEGLWSEYSTDNPGVTVEHTVMNPADMMQALQLAVRSEQAPDVMSIPAPLSTASQLVNTGWFQPATDALVLDKPFQQEVMLEGLNVIDGKPYSVPSFSFRWNSTALWFNKSMTEAAGVDPASGPEGWQAIRDLAAKTTGNGVYGLLLPIQFADRMRDHLQDLAQLAGAPGPIDWKTGEYAYAHDGFVQALEFLLSFQTDGTLHPASSSLDARQGRARWAAGEANLFFDGPWNSGVMAGNFAEALENTGVNPKPAPEPGMEAYTHSAPPVGTFWISAQSKNPEIASALFEQLTTDEYYIALAERMDQPPLDLSAVDRANVHETYKTVISGFSDVVRLAPEPLLRNRDIGKVYAEMRTVTPSLGEIIQGVFAGAVPDIRATLQDYANQMTAERDRAIEVVRGTGAEVSRDDWVFADWNPAEDFTSDKY